MFPIRIAMFQFFFFNDLSDQEQRKLNKLLKDGRRPVMRSAANVGILERMLKIFRDVMTACVRVCAFLKP